MSEKLKTSVLPSPSRVSENAFAYHRTAALRAAVGLDLFTAIGEGYDTPVAVAEHCGAAERGVRILCDYLVALGMLIRAGERYAAAPDAATFLDRRSRAYIGGAVGFVASDNMLKAVLSDPASVIRKGGTILGDAGHLVAPDHVDWMTYAHAVAPMMTRSAEFLADFVTASGGTIKRILDIAAGPGQNGIAFARRLPDAGVEAIDWMASWRLLARMPRLPASATVGTPCQAAPWRHRSLAPTTWCWWCAFCTFWGLRPVKRCCAECMRRSLLADESSRYRSC